LFAHAGAVIPILPGKTPEPGWRGHKDRSPPGYVPQRLIRTNPVSDSDQGFVAGMQGTPAKMMIVFFHSSPVLFKENNSRRLESASRTLQNLQTGTLVYQYLNDFDYSGL